MTSKPDPKHWTMHFDDSKMLEASGLVGWSHPYIPQEPKADKLYYPPDPHNELCHRIRGFDAGQHVPKEMGINLVDWHNDFDPVVQHVHGTCVRDLPIPTTTTTLDGPTGRPIRLMRRPIQIAS